MNHTQQFIEDAVAGGYEAVHYSQNKVFMGEGKTISIAFGDHILLDPLAWQAVGKVRGWEEIEMQDPHRPVNGNSEAVNNMHRFIDHLANGHTIEDALGLLADKMRV